ncbi:MAG: ABC transporter ATP-binding protein, partial [Acidobacteriota bacterium]
RARGLPRLPARPCALVEAVSASSGFRDLSDLWLALGLQVGTFLVASLLGFAALVARSSMGALFSAFIQLKVLRKITALDAYQFERSDFFDTLARAQGPSMQSPLILVNLVFSGLRQSMSIVSASIVLLAVSPFLLTIAWLIGFPSYLLTQNLGKARFDLEQGRTSRSRYLGYLTGNLIDPDRQPEIRVFGLKDFLINRWIRLRKLTAAEDIRLQARGGVHSIIGDTLSYTGYAAAMVYLVVLAVRTGAWSVGTIVMAAGSFRMTAGSIQDVLTTLGRVMEQLLFIENLEKLLGMRSRMVNGSRHLSPGDPWERIEFHDVVFHYPGKPEPSLRGVSFCIERGQRVAIVGSNGAGKSTLLKLLVRLYDPGSGLVTVDGRSLSEFHLEDYRRLFTVRFERFGRYALTARENITFGHNRDEEGFWKAVQVAGIASILRECRDGKAYLSKEFEHGRDLSEGQWSRFALARALVRAAPIVVLDEPTSFLDPRTEEEVIEAIERVTAGRTLVLVSHRASVVALANHVIFLEDGRVLADGTPAELMARCEPYARWYASPSPDAREARGAASGTYP